MSAYVSFLIDLEFDFRSGHPNRYELETYSSIRLVRTA